MSGRVNATSYARQAGKTFRLAESVANQIGLEVETVMDLLRNHFTFTSSADGLRFEKTVSNQKLVNRPDSTTPLQEASRYVYGSGGSVLDAVEARLAYDNNPELAGFWLAQEDKLTRSQFETYQALYMQRSGRARQ